MTYTLKIATAVGFGVLTAVSMKMAVFWVLMMEAERTSETLVNFYRTTRRYNPEDSHLRQVQCLAKRWKTINILRFGSRTETARGHVSQPHNTDRIAALYRPCIDL
jgi:hypothetical protein